MIVLGLAVAAPACGSKGAKSAKDADCDQAAANAIKVMRAKAVADLEKKMGAKLDETMRRLAWGLMSSDAGLPFDPQKPEKQIELVASKCRERGDSQAARNCWARAKSYDEWEACEAVGDRRAAPVAPGQPGPGSETEGLPPARVTITLDSEPQGAEIYDESMKTTVGITPFEFEVPGSREPRRFTLKLAGYSAKMIEVVPEKDVESRAVLKMLDARRSAVDVLPDADVVAGSGHAAATGGAPALGVDPDCYGDGLVCDRSRVHDAEQLAGALESTMGAAGWPVECFMVQYISGDDGEADAISVAVSGPKGAGASRCRQDPPRSAARADVARVAKNVRQLLGQRPDLRRGVDLLQVTDAVDVEVQLPVAGSR